MRIEALAPAEFKFDSATVDPPYVVDYATENNKIILNQMNLIAGVRHSIEIKNVQLGRDGGWTRWDLMTYGTELRVGETPDERDQRIDVQGFRLPGRVTVVDKTLQSMYQEQARLFPTKALFPARVGEDAKAEFTLTFTQNVLAGSDMIVSCEGAGKYELRETPFIIIGTGQVPVTVTKNDVTGSLNVKLKPTGTANEIAL